jgi:hypothetical protein
MAKQRQRKPELIDCHDCGNGVSFSATTCPYCGSIEPRGPFIHSKRDLRRLRAEERNDHNILVCTLACGGGGAFYGLVIASSPLWKILLGLGYGSLGVLIGVPIAFVINMTRHFVR